MKKLMGFIFTIIFATLLCVCTYAKTSNNFSLNLYENGKYYLHYSQYLDNENAIQIPEEYLSICKGDNCFYLIKDIEDETQANELYSCDNNLQNIKFVTYLPQDLDTITYYNNSFYFTKNIYTDNGHYTELWSINLDTKKQTKYITYSGNLLLAGISNDYLIYVTVVRYPMDFKLYKQNLNNASDKNILLSSKNYVSYELLGEKNIYLSINGNLVSININTGKLLNTYNLDYHYTPLCEYNGYLYISYKNKIYKALENNSLSLISENNDIPLQYTFCSSLNNECALISYSVKREYEVIYIYNIKTNEWTYIGKFTYPDDDEYTDC
ncbi:MAG: hypothetical protein V8S74_12020 [Lachnospirales bacterium]